MLSLPYRAVTVGISFGVVRVRASRVMQGVEVEVATFRSDGAYVDGRRPNRSSSARPSSTPPAATSRSTACSWIRLAGEVIDYVGGQADLKNHVLRAIGDPAARFREDKLRLLRADSSGGAVSASDRAGDARGHEGDGGRGGRASPPSESPRNCGECSCTRAGRRP